VGARRNFLRAFFCWIGGWLGAEETARLKNSRLGKPAGLRERTKRDFSTTQTDTFGEAKVEEKASVCFGRNDKFAEKLRAELPLIIPTTQFWFRE